MRRLSRSAAGAIALAGCLAAGTGNAADCRRTGRLPPDAVVASWYGAEHHGRRTASGVPFNEHRLTAAHPSIPMGTTVRVTNLGNAMSVDVLIIDRGPLFGRGIDLSEAAAGRLGMLACGLAPVQLALVAPARGR